MRRLLRLCAVALTVAMSAPAGAQSTPAVAAQYASAVWFFGRAPGPVTIFSIEAVRIIDPLAGTTTTATVAKDRCSGEPGPCDVEFRRVVRIPESAFRFDPALGSASVEVRTGRFVNRMTWTATPFVLPVAGCGYLVVCTCPEIVGALTAAGALRSARADGVLLGRHLSNPPHPDNPLDGLVTGSTLGELILAGSCV